MEQLTLEQWVREFHAWVQSHRTGTLLLSDKDIGRDSIYGARGMLDDVSID